MYRNVSDGNTEKIIWLSELKKMGLEPKLEILDECSTPLLLDKAERKWIRHYKSRGEAEFNTKLELGDGNRSTALKNANLEEWFQYARKVRITRSLLFGLANDTMKMTSTKNGDAIAKLLQKLDREIRHIEERLLTEFPEWTDLSKAFWAEDGEERL